MSYLQQNLDQSNSFPQSQTLKPRNTHDTFMWTSHQFTMKGVRDTCLVLHRLEFHAVSHHAPVGRCKWTPQPPPCAQPFPPPTSSSSTHQQTPLHNEEGSQLLKSTRFPPRTQGDAHPNPSLCQIWMLAGHLI